MDPMTIASVLMGICIASILGYFFFHEPYARAERRFLDPLALAPLSQKALCVVGMVHTKTGVPQISLRDLEGYISVIYEIYPKNTESEVWETISVRYNGMAFSGTFRNSALETVTNRPLKKGLQPRLTHDQKASAALFLIAVQSCITSAANIKVPV